MRRFFRRGAAKGFVTILLFMMVAVGGGLISIEDAETAETLQYPVYGDPEKPTLSYVLSMEDNAADFQDRFALSDEDLDTVLSAVRKENEALARAYGESQQVIESNKELPVEQVKSRVEASGYDGKVRKAVARTKAAVEIVLPADRRQEFKAWVEDRWQQERREFNEDPDGVYRTAASGMTFRVFATQYNGYTNYEVALPHRKLKFNGGYQVQISRDGDNWPWAPVKEVGPWNTYDNYWARNRTMWRDLRRGLPEAQAAYYNNYNRGRDEFGRKVLNPAGVDLTPAVAARLGLKRYENAWIYVYMPWVNR